MHLLEDRVDNYPGQVAAGTAPCNDSSEGEHGFTDPALDARWTCKMSGNATTGKSTERAWRMSFISEMEL